MGPTPPPVPPNRTFRPARRHLWLALGGVALIALLVPLLRWRQLSSDALRQLLRAEMTRVSDSVYVLQISPVHLRFLPGAISFDSAYVTTDTIRRAAAFPNRPELRIGVHGCQLSGVNVWKLVRKQGLYGSLFRCSAVRIGAQVAATDSLGTPAPTKREGGLDFLKLRRELRLPAELPVINVQEVEFPDIRLDLTRQRPDLPTERVALQKFSARFEDVVVDPQLPLAERHPLFARQIALAAEELAIGSGEETVSFKRMAADLDEGSFTLIGLRVAPTDTASVWFRRQKFRRPWVQLVADSVRFAGIDLAQLIMDGKVVTQQIIIGGLDATIETDASLPERPRSAVPPVSPVQEAAAAAATGVRLEADTVELIDGTARYTGHRPGRPSTSVWLPHFAFQARDILIDPALAPSQQRPLLAKVAELNLDGATWTTGDSLKSMTLGQLRLRVGDSVLVARQLTVGPAISDASWMRRQKVRQTLGRARVDSVVFRGVNYDDLVVRSTLQAREMTVSGVRVRLQKDMSLPAPPPHAERASPALDSTLADIGVPTRIERLRAEGDVTYIEHHRGLPDREFTVRKVALSGDRLAVATEGVRVPLLAQHLRIVLTDIDRHWGKVRSLAVGTVTANFGDSTLSIDSIRVAPHFTSTPRRSSVHVALDSMRFSGVNFVRLADGRGANIQRAIFGNASVDVKVDAGIASSPASRLPSPDSSFTGFSFPIAIRDLQVLRGRGLYTKTEPGKAPLVLSLGKVIVNGRMLALQRGVTRPLLEQDLVVRVSSLDVSGDPAHGHATSAAISLGDSSIALKGIKVRTGSARDSVPAGTRAGNGVVLAVDSVRVGGIHFGDLVRGKAVRLGRVAVGTVDAEVRHVAGPKDSVAAAPADREAGQKDGLPITVGDLRIPVVHFRYVDTKPDGQRRIVSVKRASLTAEQLSLNPGASREVRIRRVARRALITADGIVIDDNPMSSFTVSSFAANLADSAVQVRGIYIGPTVSDSVWVSRQDHRRDRIRVTADSVFLTGFDADRLVHGDGLWVRHQRVFGLDIDAYTDKNLKPDSVSKKHSSAQQDVQSIKFPFGVDTISVIGGLVAYHELDVGKPEAGTMTFSDITATVTGFTSRGVAGRSPPLRIATHSTIFGAGKLEAYAEAPLTSSGFDVVYHGRLGPMPAAAVNQFAEKALPVTIEGGQVEEVTFSVGSKNGHAVGNIVPIYRGLKVKLHDSKASLFKRIEYSVLTFVAKEFFIRHDNPGKAGQPPRVGVIDHTFDGESIIQFLWYAVRGGIEKSILK